MLKEAQDIMEQLIKMYHGTKELYKFTPEGFPKEEILNTAKEWEADVVVMVLTAKQVYRIFCKAALLNLLFAMLACRF